MLQFEVNLIPSSLDYNLLYTAPRLITLFACTHKQIPAMPHRGFEVLSMKAQITAFGMQFST